MPEGKQFLWDLMGDCHNVMNAMNRGVRTIKWLTGEFGCPAEEIQSCPDTGCGGPQTWHNPLQVFQPPVGNIPSAKSPQFIPHLVKHGLSNGSWIKQLVLIGLRQTARLLT
jgi:hypothetical protein